jgi:Chromo (CHRromatin Organisation MOdifier) domain
MMACGTDHRLSTAHHQQTDGQTERKIQELLQYLRHYLDFNQENWVEILPIAQFALNDVISSITGMTPHEAIWGKRISMRWENSEQSQFGKDKSMIYQQMAKDIEWEAVQAKKYYDKRRMEAPNLKRGDRVYIRRRTAGSRDFNLRSLRPSQKLDHVKYGAFPVVRKLENDNYELQLPSRMKIHPVFHISLLEPTKNPRNKENEMITEEQEWEVEGIIGKRIRKGSVEYKVRWTGYESDDDTWEPVRLDWQTLPTLPYPYPTHTRRR